MTALHLGTQVIAGVATVLMLCRIRNLQLWEHRPEVIGLHVLLACVSIASGLHAYQRITDVQDVLCPLLTLCWWIVSLPTWRNGPPRSAESKPMPLDDAALEHYRGGCR